MLNNPGLKFSWMTSNTVGFIFPDITEFAAGEHPQAYEPKHLLPCHFDHYFEQARSRTP